MTNCERKEQGNGGHKGPAAGSDCCVREGDVLRGGNITAVVEEIVKGAIALRRFTEDGSAETGDSGRLKILLGDLSILIFSRIHRV